MFILYPVSLSQKKAVKFLMYSSEILQWDKIMKLYYIQKTEGDTTKFKDIILDIYNNADYTLGNGDWRGQPKPVTFYVKGNDVVVVSADDEFITILKGGVNNARVISARLKNAG